MKKMIMLSIMALLLACGSAFADGSYAPSSGGTLTLGSTVTVVVKPSANVYTYYQSGGTDGIAYVLSTYHNKGTRSFGTSSGDSKIFYIDTTATNPPSAPTTADGTAEYSADGWSPL